jgi:chemotaxis protein methyltransferase CheR
VEWLIEASDISHRMLEHARQAIYPLDTRHALAPDLLHRYFQRGVNGRAGKCRVKVELRQRVCFRRVNLFQAEYPVAGGQHVIFCRNVMIYFDKTVQQRVVSMLEDHLAPGGYLFISHSESLNGITHKMQWVAPAVFRRSPQ